MNDQDIPEVHIYVLEKLQLEFQVYHLLPNRLVCFVHQTIEFNLSEAKASPRQRYPQPTSDFCFGPNCANQKACGSEPDCILAITLIVENQFYSDSSLLNDTDISTCIWTLDTPFRDKIKEFFQHISQSVTWTCIRVWQEYLSRIQVTQ